MNDDKVRIEYGFSVIRNEPMGRLYMPPYTLWQRVLILGYWSLQVALLATSVLCFAYALRH